jgi:hypothetical protein
MRKFKIIMSNYSSTPLSMGEKLQDSSHCPTLLTVLDVIYILRLFILFYFFYFFEIGSPYVAQASPNSRSPCLSLPSAGISEPPHLPLYCVFFYTYILMIKFSLEIRHSKRLKATPNNKIEQLEQYTVIKRYINMVFLLQNTLLILLFVTIWYNAYLMR